MGGIVIFLNRGRWATGDALFDLKQEESHGCNLTFWYLSSKMLLEWFAVWPQSHCSARGSEPRSGINKLRAEPQETQGCWGRWQAQQGSREGSWDPPGCPGDKIWFLMFQFWAKCLEDGYLLNEWHCLIDWNFVKFYLGNKKGFQWLKKN